MLAIYHARQRLPRDPLEPQAAGGPEELRDSERTYASTHSNLDPTGPGTRRGSRAASRPEERLRDSEWSHGCPRDAVTVCFQSCHGIAGHGRWFLTCFSELAHLDSELGVRENHTQAVEP